MAVSNFVQEIAGFNLDFIFAANVTEKGKLHLKVSDDGCSSLSGRDQISHPYKQHVNLYSVNFSL
jgi:hypothetical protein